MVDIDPRMLVHTVRVKKKIGEDKYQKPIYDTAIKFVKVRFDKSQQFTGSGDSKELFSNGVVFLYQRYTSNFGLMDETFKDGIVTDEQGHDYIIKQVTPLSGLFTASAWSYELDVI